MKNISDYITYNKRPERKGLWTLEEYCDVNGLNINDLSESNITDYYNTLYKYIPDCAGDTYEQWVNETLTSHSREKLLNSLKVALGRYFVDFVNISEKNLQRGAFGLQISVACPIISDETLETNQLTNCRLSDKIYKILRFYNYYISCVDEDELDVTIYIEPYFTERANDEIKKNGNIVYHITHKDLLKDIMRTGLRPKVGKTRGQGGYRYFSERTYLVGHSDNIKQDIEDIIEDKHFEEGEYVVLKIDLNKHNVSLWYDDASQGSLNVYTLEAIPPQIIEVVSI